MKSKVLMTLWAALMLTACGQELVVTPEPNDVNGSKIYTYASDTVSNITDEIARKVANKYTASAGASRALTVANEVVTIRDEKGDAVMYAVNMAGDKGFVVVSASRATEPILAVVEEGRYDPKEVGHMGLKEWEESMTEWINDIRANEELKQIHAAEWLQLTSELQECPSSRSSYISPELQTEIFNAQNEWASNGWTYYSVDYWLDNAVHNPATGLESRMRELQNEISHLTHGPISEISYLVIKDYSTQTLVGPMISTKWDQDAPYNARIPNETHAGCTTIALAQILKYHATIPGYNYSAMPNVLTHADNETCCFIYDIGKKIGIRYEKGEYSATIDQVASCLSSYNYSYEKKDFTTDNVRNSLNNRLPVYVRGTSSSNDGHAWVCDGLLSYNIDNRYVLMVPRGSIGDVSGVFLEDKTSSNMHLSTKFRYNWGWGGLYDGYYGEGIWPSENANYGKDRKILSEIKPKN